MAILKNEDWNIEDFHPPNHELVPPKSVFDPSIPFAERKKLIVDVPLDPRGIVDVYIDDTVLLTVDLPSS